MSWRKSSYSVSSECVEVDTDWRTSSYSSESANCVEFRTSSYSAVALVRDSKETDDAGNNTSPVLSFDASNWRRFIGWVSRG